MRRENLIYALPQDRDLVVEVRQRVDRRPVHVAVHSQQSDLLCRQNRQSLVEQARRYHDLIVKNAISLKGRHDRVGPADMEVLVGPAVCVDACAQINQ